MLLDSIYWNLVRNVSHLYSWYWWIAFLWCLCLVFDIGVMLASGNEVEVFSLQFSARKFVKNWSSFFLKLWWYVPVKPSRPGVSFVERCLATNSISFIEIELFSLSVSSWVSFDIMSFKKFVHFICVFKFINIKLFKIFSYVFKVCSILCSELSFVLYIGNSFFPDSVCLEVYQFYWSSPRSSFSFIDFFPPFYFSIIYFRGWQTFYKGQDRYFKFCRLYSLCSNFSTVLFFFFNIFIGV